MAQAPSFRVVIARVRVIDLRTEKAAVMDDVFGEEEGNGSGTVEDRLFSWASLA